MPEDEIAGVVANVPFTNTGHGHVWPLADGAKARCMGLPMCGQCAADAEALERWQLANKLVGLNLDEIERTAIPVAIEHCKGNRTHAAKVLGISLRTLQRKIVKLRLPVLPVSTCRSSQS